MIFLLFQSRYQQSCASLFFFVLWLFLQYLQFLFVTKSNWDWICGEVWWKCLQILPPRYFCLYSYELFFFSELHILSLKCFCYYLLWIQWPLQYPLPLLLSVAKIFKWQLLSSVQLLNTITFRRVLFDVFLILEEESYFPTKSVYIGIIALG